VLLKINRLGKFTVEKVQGLEIQCGTVGMQEYTYHLSIEATDAHLTAEGYVADNYEIFAYFHGEYHGKKATDLSCERIAIKAVHHFVNLFHTRPDLRPVELKQVYCKVSGSTESFIEAMWKAPVTRQRYPTGMVRVAAPTFKRS
jgi:hypothetical protein